MNMPAMTGTTAPVPLSNMDQITERLDSLRGMLQAQSPGYESVLHQIHSMLQRDPNLSLILTEEQIGIIVSGLSKKKNIVIVEGVVKNKKKAAKDIGVSDL